MKATTITANETSLPSYSSSFGKGGPVSSVVSSSSSLITVATCALNQWALDFDGNLERILRSCRQAKADGAQYRLGPELEIPGYGCEDHFYETDTIDHCWESLSVLLTSNEATVDLVCDFGMPILASNGCRYNCRVICYNNTIILIRPKAALADDGNYRESRYFTAYRSSGRDETTPCLEDFIVPSWIYSRFPKGHPRVVPFGLGHVSVVNNVNDDNGNGLGVNVSDGSSGINGSSEVVPNFKIGCESCEEVWTPSPPHVDLVLRGGVDVIGNGSASHHVLRKLDQRLELMVAATRKVGGVYLYSNQRGCDGSGRLYFDGAAMIVCNGKVLAQTSQFSLKDVEVITATIDLNDVWSYRASIPSFGVQAVQVCSQPVTPTTHGVYPVNVNVTSKDSYTSTTGLTRSQTRTPTPPMEDGIQLSTPEEECCLGPACWMWDYLRRSGATGFLLPLSGGADSSSVATIVSAMCHLVYDHVTSIASTADYNDDIVLKDLKRICNKQDNDNDDPSSPSSWLPSSPQDIANHVLHTVFMGTENSSQITTSRAQRLGSAVGSYHLAVPIDLMVSAVIKVFQLTTGKTPQFVVRGGTMAEDLALQNIQARLRMVTAYLFAQLLPWCRSRNGFLLVLGSANVDEGLRGYMTKYDCSSADLNPIGAISKGDLKRMLLWAADKYDGHGDVLKEIAGAPPTAELRPNDSKGEGVGDGKNDGGDTAEHSQLDEEEMGMTYDELGWFGRLRKISRCGPVSMYRKLVVIWKDTCSPTIVAQKVQRFFYYYSVNRHKMCTLTPSYHAEAYSPDDNRFDLRPFLYNTKWPRQFFVMNQLVQADEEKLRQGHS